MKTLETKTRAYNVTSRLRDGETYDLYLAEIEGDTKKRPVLVKIAGDRGLNHYAEQEAKVLKHLNRELAETSRPVKLLVPELLDEFMHGECAAIVTDYAVGYWTLTELRGVYKDGVPPDHVAWIFNRLLQALIAAHMTGVIHGKVLPHHLVVRSGNKSDDMRHTAVLVDWTCAVVAEPNKWPPLGAMTEDYAEYLPARGRATPAGLGDHRPRHGGRLRDLPPGRRGADRGGPEDDPVGHGPALAELPREEPGPAASQPDGVLRPVPDHAGPRVRAAEVR